MSKEAANILLGMWAEIYQESWPDQMPSTFKIIKECLHRKVLKIHYIGTKFWIHIDPEWQTHSVYRITFWLGVPIKKAHLGTTKPFFLCKTPGEQKDSLYQLVQEARNIEGEFMEVDVP